MSPTRQEPGWRWEILMDLEAGDPKECLVDTDHDPAGRKNVDLDHSTIVHLLFTYQHSRMIKSVC